MIKVELIEPHVNKLIDDFQKSFPDSFIFKKDPQLMRNNLIALFNVFFNEKKVTKEHETYIHEAILSALNIKLPVLDQLIVRTPDELEEDYLMRMYGPPVGSVLALSNRAIHRIAADASKDFDERVEKLQSQ